MPLQCAASKTILDPDGLLAPARGPGKEGTAMPDETDPEWPMLYTDADEFAPVLAVRDGWPPAHPVPELRDLGPGAARG
jgi:hypothetical protein